MIIYCQLHGNVEFDGAGNIATEAFADEGVDLETAAVPDDDYEGVGRVGGGYPLTRRR